MGAQVGDPGWRDGDGGSQQHIDIVEYLLDGMTARQQLLAGMRAQPNPVEVREHAQTDPRDRGVQDALHDEVAASSGSRPSTIWPSRKV